jgi:transcriptional regulator with XRE-family HTH domain
MHEDTRPDAAAGLGPFLRACRDRFSPAEAQLPAVGRRRVPGLRRDEVAALAGVSLSYYRRLEQGRERSPSTQVLDAIARALRLGDDERRELFRLAGPAPRRTRSPARIERVRPHLELLIDGWTTTPAYIVGHAQDVLAANALADALFCDFAGRDNLLRMLFLDPAATAFYRSAERARHHAVAGLRQAAERTPADPRILELVGELSVRSGEFRSMWAREHRPPYPYLVEQVHHSAVGDLELRHEALDLRSAPGQHLVVLQAEPGSASADGLSLLGAIGAPALPHQ